MTHTDTWGRERNRKHLDTELTGRWDFTVPVTSSRLVLLQWCLFGLFLLLLFCFGFTGALFRSTGTLSRITGGLIGLFAAFLLALTARLCRHTHTHIIILSSSIQIIFLITFMIILFKRNKTVPFSFNFQDVSRCWWAKNRFVMIKTKKKCGFVFVDKVKITNN